MKTIFHKESNTYNFIHKSGVQTSIKLSPSGHFEDGNLDRKSPLTEDKCKYTVIVSSSLGCQLSCTFCHLTKTGKSFSALSSKEVTSNVLEAISEVYRLDKSIGNKYIKLCYMGEGEALLNMGNTEESALTIIHEVIKAGYAVGLDGVDISTAMPRIPQKLILGVSNLNESLKKERYKLNPSNHNQTGRSAVRLFYSLHHYDQVQRDLIIPNTHSIHKTLSLLNDVHSFGINIVVHYMFMQGVNDSLESVCGLVDFINNHHEFKNFEFRVLRYNSYSDDTESSKLPEIVKILGNELQVGKLKIQYSAGEEIKAACGMFI